MKARMLLKKLTDYGLTVKQIDDKIRLSPPYLVNDKVISFVRAHKNDLLYALHDETPEKHLERKNALHPGRLHIMKVLIRRFLNVESCRQMVNYKDKLPINDNAIEDYLEMELVNFDYDLEAMINMYRHYTPPVNNFSITCKKCGYNPPFCSCEILLSKENENESREN